MTHYEKETKLKLNQRVFLLDNLFEDGIKIVLFRELKGETLRVYDPLECGTVDELLEVPISGNWYDDLEEAKKIAVNIIDQEAGRLFRLQKKIKEMI
jgi:hypothetical protein